MDVLIETAEKIFSAIYDLTETEDIAFSASSVLTETADVSFSAFPVLKHVPIILLPFGASRIRISPHFTKSSP